MDSIAPARQDEPAPPKVPAGNGAGRPSLVGADMAGLAIAVQALGEPPFRAKQLRHWIYHRGARSFEEMTSISKAARSKLAERYTLGRPAPADMQVSSDGTRKWLLRFADGAEAEMVFIPEEDRGTLCISSQVGCTLNCRFCHTGTQPWVRNLDAG
ncbi:MAG: 23S rRNA (adenine(2503)-C(2))-methyltransferase RlmN, partial [Rhodospirillaceae bacterium]|nr:23S rRNA (adenine(2503)-C(2))-methyltransferase RlmN [Rhodospirillaceae bacterium]